MRRTPVTVSLIVSSSIWLAACGDDSPPSGGAGGGGAPAVGGQTAGGGGAGMLVCNEPFVTKGPWSFGIDETSAKIRWEACAEDSVGGVLISPEDGGDQQSADSTVETFTLTETHTAPLSSVAPPDYAGTYYMHEVALSDLQPGTCYRYALAGAPAREGRVCTARPSGDPFTFLAIGDTNPALGSTAATLSHVLPEDPDFTIHGGDIQYYSSLLETWAFWFPIMQPMLSQGAFMPALGNHESELNDELDQYALRFFGGAGFGGTSTYYRFQSGGVWFFNLDTEVAISQGTEQAIWLQAELESAAAQPGFRGSIVYLHRPLITCGDSGDDAAALAHFTPIFEANEVLFVIQAHMHGYERFEFPTGPTFITTAGGGGLIGDVDENIDRPYCDQRVASGDYYHGTIFRVGATAITGEAIDRDGAVRDTFSKPIP